MTVIKVIRSFTFFTHSCFDGIEKKYFKGIV